MSLVSPVAPVEYKGDGTKTQFTFPFPYDDKKDVVVELCTYGTNNWIKQNEGGSYRFLNDNTIVFKVAPKNVGGGDSQNAIKISRQTYARRILANTFATSRPECEVVDITCRGNTDGTNGTFTDDRDEAARPYKVGDTITYNSPCDDGANVYWYTTPTSGGSATLIRTDFVRGLTKTTSLVLDSTHIDKRISVKVKCIGCGPPDGLCCEWTVNTDNDVLDSNGCGLSAVIGSTAKKMLHHIQSGYGVIKLTLTSPDIGRTFNVAFPDGTSYDYTVGGGDTPSAEKVIPKPDDSAYVIITVPDASSKGWQYSLRCTEAVDTSKYKYCRFVGDIKSYYGGRWSGGVWGWGTRYWIPAEDTSSQSRSTWKFPKKSTWLEYNPGTKTDGYATINGPGIAEFNAYAISVFLYGSTYFGDQPSRGIYEYQPVPWRSSYTVMGMHNGVGIYFGSLSVNSKGCPDCSPDGTRTYVKHFSLSNDSWMTVAGYWEFSNDTADDKVVEASWDGYRGDAYSTKYKWINGAMHTEGEVTVDDSYMPNLTDIN